MQFPSCCLMLSALLLLLELCLEIFFFKKSEKYFFISPKKNEFTWFLDRKEHRHSEQLKVILLYKNLTFWDNKIPNFDKLLESASGCSKITRFSLYIVFVWLRKGGNKTKAFVKGHLEPKLNCGRSFNIHSVSNTSLNSASAKNSTFYYLPHQQPLSSCDPDSPKFSKYFRKQLISNLLPNNLYYLQNLSLTHFRRLYKTVK